MNAYDTDPNRVALALIVGAAVGAFVITVAMLTFVYASGYAADGRIMWLEPGKFAVLFYIGALGVFAMGLLTIGAALWAVFHRMGWRNWTHATALGFVGSTFTSIILDEVIRMRAGGRFGPVPWTWLAIGLSGAVARFVIWRIAYRRVPVAP